MSDSRLTKITQKLVAFRDAREWKQFHHFAVSDNIDKNAAKYPVAKAKDTHAK